MDARVEEWWSLMSSSPLSPQFMGRRTVPGTSVIVTLTLTPCNRMRLRSSVGSWSKSYAMMIANVFKSSSPGYNVMATLSLAPWHDPRKRARTKGRTNPFIRYDIFTGNFDVFVWDEGRQFAQRISPWCLSVYLQVQRFCSQELLRWNVHGKYFSNTTGGCIGVSSNQWVGFLANSFRGNGNVHLTPSLAWMWNWDYIAFVQYVLELAHTHSYLPVASKLWKRDRWIGKYVMYPAQLSVLRYEYTVLHYSPRSNNDCIINAITQLHMNGY